MMNFDEFLEATRARVQEELPDTAVKVQQVNKLQGESYVGIAVQPEGAAAAATFNVGPAFERYQADPSQESTILDKIATDAKQVSAAIPVFEVNNITDYKSARDGGLVLYPRCSDADCVRLHHFHHRAAYLEFHSDSDRDGGFSSPDYCRNRSN